MNFQKSESTKPPIKSRVLAYQFLDKIGILTEHKSNENVGKSRIEQTPKEIPHLCERCNNLSICKYVDDVSKAEENLKSYCKENLEDLPLGIYLYCSNHTNKDRNFE